MIFEAIKSQKPAAAIILGDVVSKGSRERKWVAIDSYIATCREGGIQVTALLGNHDVMSNIKKGELNFQKRFPEHQRGGYTIVLDSMAIVLLNSNFHKLSSSEVRQQNDWLQNMLTILDNNPGILGTIVTCHHAPYSNSRIVGSSKDVRTNFVQPFLRARKTCLFMTGHSHAFEHFLIEGKNFLVIGGGGGISQPLRSSRKKLSDLSATYKPMFHYLTMQRKSSEVLLTSKYLMENFSGFQEGYSLTIKLSQ